MKYTKYETARIIGSRALQISMGAPFLIEIDKEQLEVIRYSPIEIAKLEFEKGLIPITVKRPVAGKRQYKESCQFVQMLPKRQEHEETTGDESNSSESD